jgi:hypothetical protein
VLYLDVLKVGRVLHQPPRLLLLRLGVSSSSSLPCILLRLWRRCGEGQWTGRAVGWWCRRKRTLSPSISRVGSDSVPSVFLLREMLRWDCSIGGPQCQPTIRLVKLCSDALLALDVRVLVPPNEQ